MGLKKTKINEVSIINQKFTNKQIEKIKAHIKKGVRKVLDEHDDYPANIQVGAVREVLKKSGKNIIDESRQQNAKNTISVTFSGEDDNGDIESYTIAIDVEKP